MIMWIPVCLLISCTKIKNEDDMVYTKRSASVPIPRPLLSQLLQTIVCISGCNDFYTYVWQLVNGLIQTCPYFATDLWDARFTFTDGYSILCQQTVISSDGSFGSEGIALQNISCQPIIKL